MRVKTLGWNGPALAYGLEVLPISAQTAVMNLPPESPSPITVGLLWHSVNSDNLGVTALTFSNVAIIDRVAAELSIPVRYMVLGWADKGKRQLTRDDVAVLAMRGKDIIRPTGLYKSVRQCDFVLDISAGDSFADIYGTGRYRFNLMAKTAVFAARRPLIMSPQTIGPFNRFWTRQTAKLAMRAATAVLSRDNLSTAYARNMGIVNVIEATDVAFRLPYEVHSARLGQGVEVGLNVSGLLFNGGYTGDNMFGLKTAYPELIRDLIRRFAAIDGCKVHLVGHVNSDIHAIEDDYRICQALAAEFPTAVLAPRFSNPSEAKTYISKLDFFTGSRMHACIAAFSSGVPVVPMAYSRKFVGLFGSLGYAHVADCKSETNHQVIEKIMFGFANRSTLKVEVDAGRELAEQRLQAYEEVLKGMFLRLARKTSR